MGEKKVKQAKQTEQPRIQELAPAKKPVAVIAFGGNALLRPQDHGTQEEQFTLAWKATRWLVEIIHRGYELVIVHGNGPQVGNIMIQVEEAITKIPPQTLDVCVAQTQGSMGFMLANQLRNRFNEEQLDKPIATVLSEVEVDRDDPAFENPSKPVGPYFTAYRANLLMQEQGWQMVEDAGRGWRKVVASPPPTAHPRHRMLRKRWSTTARWWSPAAAAASRSTRTSAATTAASRR